MGKSRFEKWLWEHSTMEVSHYHGNNGILTADEYRKDCDYNGQTQSFSGVGDHHRNARVERAIQTIMYMTLTLTGHI